jgi:Protein of unknown function (DUF3035).|tara:strand:- start:458 stop:775 length:318 start_codon:yes stop_codon:yes gene_type:complete
MTMRKNIFSYLMISFFFIVSCSSNDWASIKRGVTGAKSTDTDEFLVQKKDPLILPPEYDKLPTPGDRRTARQEISIFEETLSETDQEVDSSTSIEESILKKIKKQ